MSASKRWKIGAFSVVFVHCFCLAPVMAGAAEAPLPWRGQDRVDVELRTVPFYVVDAAGQPVANLTAADFELSVGGVAVSFDTFDHFGGVPPAQSTPSGAPPAGLEATKALEATNRRRVVLWLDLTFLSPIGLVRSQEVLARYLADLPESDILYLMSNAPKRGLRQELGPLPADLAGKAAVQRAVEAMVTDPASHFDDARGVEMDSGPGRNGVPTTQLGDKLDRLRADSDRREFALASDLADHYQQVAAFLAGLPGAKVLVALTPGIRRGMYFEGSNGLMAGTSGMYHVRTRHTPALLPRFEEPLSALGESGALAVFVNPEQAEGVGRDMLAHAREKTGGVLLEGTDPIELSARLAGSLSSYYELGFYANQLPVGAKSGEIEIRVRRQGLRVFYPSRLSSRLASLEMGALGKRFWVVDLVQNGLDRQRVANEDGRLFHDLPGRAAGRAVGSGRQLVFEPEWSALPAGGNFEVFEVVLAVEPGAKTAEIHRFESSPLATAVSRGQLSALLPESGARVWGVVAVDPATGETWLRRFLLESPATQAAVAKATSAPGKGTP